MSRSKAKIVVMVALSGATFVVACGGGSDPAVTLGSFYEQRPGDFQKPTQADQDPSPAAQQGSAGGVATTTNPPGEGDRDGGTSGGTSGNTSGMTSGMTSGNTSGMTSGGTSGTMAGCPPCDGMFTCTVTVTGGMPQQAPVTLSSKNGVCVFPSAQGDVVFACGGTLLQNGGNVGTWSNCAKTSNPPTQSDAG